MALILAEVEAARARRTPAPDQILYRCSLPGLTGFVADRREDANASHHGPLKNMAEREGFEPSNTFWDVTHFPGERLRPLGHLSIRTTKSAPLGLTRAQGYRKGNRMRN